MYISVAQIIISVILIVLILLQERSSGLSGVFGGGDESGFYQTRRGLERVIFGATIFLIAVLIILSLWNIYLK
jgi:protein translocase SecG subunit